MIKQPHITVVIGIITLALIMGFHEIVAQAPIHVSSCDSGRGTPRKYSDDVPCDIHDKSYCTEPGDSYPKSAVRQFVSDNQGLMRRMYGDLRHLSVLRSEMDWEGMNDIQQTEVRRPSSVAMFEELNSSEEDTNVTSDLTTTESNRTSSTNTTDIPIASEMSDGKIPVEKTKEKGISACPTKKEVVAPYWAVNTRGRSLAIVNDPPYEQHIHWEKCLQENQQMLCRDGCKCEQQQRLQRLLAFDPNCDCKGVFMDWFLLPSCCVCKCYGLSYDNVTTASQNVTSGRRTGRLHLFQNATDNNNNEN